MLGTQSQYYLGLHIYFRSFYPKISSWFFEELCDLNANIFGFSPYQTASIFQDSFPNHYAINYPRLLYIYFFGLIFYAMNHEGLNHFLH